MKRRSRRSAGLPAPPRGFALILVLWGTALLAVIAGSFAFGMRTESRLSASFYSRAQAGAVAEAGINRGILALLAENEDERWRADGTPHEVALANGLVRVSITAESAKIDLNRAPEPLIRGLVAVAAGGESSGAIAEAILDWRDKDSNRHADGAEDADYAAAGLPYRAGDRPFASLAELSQVLGMTPQLQATLGRLATVHSPARAVDPMTASRDVLLALPGLVPAQVDEFLLAREDALAQGLLPPAEILSIARSHLLRVVPSRRPTGAFTIQAESEVGGARAWRQAVVQVARRRGPVFTILAWNDAARSHGVAADDETGSESP